MEEGGGGGGSTPEIGKGLHFGKSFSLCIYVINLFAKYEAKTTINDALMYHHL